MCASFAFLHIDKLNFLLAAGCEAITANSSGVYLINVAPPGDIPEYKNVYCDGRGWMVITQYRMLSY